MLDQDTINKYKKYFDYLENLRQSGATNMYGAGAYLELAFGLNEKEADKILGLWMHNYSQLSKELGWQR